jgi:hypothetical protein
MSYQTAPITEVAASACGELSAAVDWAGGAASDLVLASQAARTFGTEPGLAEHLILERHRLGDGTPSSSVSMPASFIEALDAAELGAAIGDGVRSALASLDTIGDTDATGVRHAAMAAGACIAPAPASRDSLRAGALVAGIALVRTGLLDAPWVAPVELDATARTAAVQADRTDRWDEWTAAWCALLARDARAVARRLHALRDRFARDRATVRVVPRVGSTDDAVLEWLQSHMTFTIRDAAAGLGLTTPTVGTAIERLERARIATELTGQRRDRVWVASASLAFVAQR